MSPGGFEGEFEEVDNLASLLRGHGEGRLSKQVIGDVGVIGIPGASARLDRLRPRFSLKVREVLKRFASLFQTPRAESVFLGINPVLEEAGLRP